MKPNVSVITITLNRSSLKETCESVNNQSYSNWHHYVLGDGLLPTLYDHPQRSVLGFSKVMGITEPGANMPNGTPNPIQRWALKNLDLGEYVCFLDDDNTYNKNYIACMVNALENDPNAGVALCGAVDARYHQNIDGYPEVGRCDNSAFMARRHVVKEIEFPHASLDRNVVQDCEYIILCANRFGFVNVNKKLLNFGMGMNIPPDRGKVYFLESWKVPQDAFYLAYDGDYNKAISLLSQIVMDYPNDAWSIWKCFEIYMLMKEQEKAEKYLEDWCALYLKAEHGFHNHHALLFAYATYLKFKGEKYRDIVNKNIKAIRDKLAQSPDKAEYYFALARNYRLLGAVDDYNISVRKAIEIEPDQTFWAYKLAKWEWRVFKAVFTDEKHNGMINMAILR